MKVEKIGLFGFGTVGSGVYHILTKHQASIEKKTGVSLQIEKALVKEPELFEDQIPGITFTSDVDYILNDEEISIIVEVLGGVDFSFNCVKKALESGKHVVTANKDLLAKHGVELSQIARENNAISVTGDALGEILLYGKGAGSHPTASSIAQHLQEQLPSKLGNYEIRVLTVD